jgi:hypothetical protein
MAIFSKKRTVSSSLVCLFCVDLNPAWFTKQNADRVPSCTSCHLHLVPSSFKEVLISGICPEVIEVDTATGLAAAMSAMTMLWASVNSSTDPVVAKSPVSWDVWNPEIYPDWPFISQGEFLHTFGDGALLSSQHLGNLASQMPFLALMSSNLLWRVHDNPTETVVSLWPKTHLAMVSAGNIEAIKKYLELVRSSSSLAIWQLIDRLLELIEMNPQLLPARKLFGFDITLHNFTELPLRDVQEFRQHEDFSSSQQLQTMPGSRTDPFGKDVAKRLYSKSETRHEFEILGPFGLTVKVEVSETYEKHPRDQQRIKLIRSFSFKVLASGDSEKQAEEQVRDQLFDNFGFVIKRNGQNWIVDKKRGVDYFEGHSEDLHESQLYSKVVDVQACTPEDWSGTAWRLRCS